MSRTACIIPILILVAAVLILSTGCDPYDLPTAPSRPALGIEDEVLLHSTHLVRTDRMGGFPRLVAEAKDALIAVYDGEQVYVQRFGSYTNTADIDDIRLKLGVDLSTVSSRWSFVVRDVSATGFVAVAQGRRGTAATGLIVTLRFVRGQPLMWSVERRHHGHASHDPTPAGTSTGGSFRSTAPARLRRAVRQDSGSDGG